VPCLPVCSCHSVHRPAARVCATVSLQQWAGAGCCSHSARSAAAVAALTAAQCSSSSSMRSNGATCRSLLSVRCSVLPPVATSGAVQATLSTSDQCCRCRHPIYTHLHTHTHISARALSTAHPCHRASGIHMVHAVMHSLRPPSDVPETGQQCYMLHPSAGLHVTPISRFTCYTRQQGYMLHPSAGLHVTPVSRVACYTRQQGYMLHAS
jgi:hypothetical protein